MDGNQGNNAPTNNENSQVDLMAYALVLTKWRGFIIKSVLIVTILSVAISLILPQWYRATVSILPPKDAGMLNPFAAISGTGSMGSILRNLPLASKSNLGVGMGAYNYLAILKSRTAMESVIRKFDLTKVYDVGDNSMEKAIKELESNVQFEVQSEDYITIDVWDKDPQRSADIANYFVEVLNQISNRLGTQEAHSNRKFIEKRVAKSREDLHTAEEALKVHQEQSGMLISPDKESSSISAVAEIYAMKARKEVEIGIVSRTTTSDNPVLQQLKIELSEIDKKVAEIPQAGIEALRLYRELVTQQKIIEFLIPLYEQSKVNEQKDVPVILVLDMAIQPERKDRPKRMLIVLSSALSALLLSVGFVFLSERFLQLKQDKPRQYEILKNAFGKQSIVK